jgi:hypothetical protein
MSLENYQSLQSASENASLGAKLPTLSYGSIAVTQRYLNAQETIQTINALKATHGWVMYRDELIISTQIGERVDLIEAEYTNGESSIAIKLVRNDYYSVCSMMKLPVEDHSMVYKTQSFYTRNALPTGGLIQYRLWFKQQTGEITQGRWEPFAQQFIGFTAQEER